MRTFNSIPEPLLVPGIDPANGHVLFIIRKPIWQSTNQESRSIFICNIPSSKKRKHCVPHDILLFDADTPGLQRMIPKDV